MSSIGYKIVQTNSNLCGGPCAFDSDDYDNYYWLWDVNDFVEVKQVNKQPHELRPYDRGKIEMPFQWDYFSITPELHTIRGGAYDPDSNMLDLAPYDAGSIGQYKRLPVFVAYSIELTNSPPDPTVMAEHSAPSINLAPNPTAGEFRLSAGSRAISQVAVMDQMGRVVQSGNSVIVDIGSVSDGVYLVKVTLDDDEVLVKRVVKH